MTRVPRICAVVMLGQGKFNAGVLIGPVSEFQFDYRDEQKFTGFRNLTWYGFTEQVERGLTNHIRKSHSYF